MTEIDPSVRSKYCVLPDTFWDAYRITETSEKMSFLEEDFPSEERAFEFLKKFVEIYPEENEKYECFKTMFSNGYRLRLKQESVVPVLLRPVREAPVYKWPEEVVKNPVEFLGFKVPTEGFQLTVKQPEPRLEEILAKRYLTPEDAKENLMKIEEKERIKYCVLPNSHSGYSIKDLSQKYSFLKEGFGELQAFTFLEKFSQLYPEEGQKFECYQLMSSHGYGIRRKEDVKAKEPMIVPFVPQPTRDAPVFKEKQDAVVEKKPAFDPIVIFAPKTPVKPETPLKQEALVVKKALVEQKNKLPEPQAKEEFQKKYFDSYTEAFQFWFKITETERFNYRIEHEPKNGYCVIKIK